jgi:hypothetical protein
MRYRHKVRAFHELIVCMVDDSYLPYLLPPATFLEFFPPGSRRVRN